MQLMVQMVRERSSSDAESLSPLRPWHRKIDPPERFENGRIGVPVAPGFGVELNETVAREHA